MAAFTLIELLVVVTIIVVLMSLLAPSLEQAIFQGELAACGAQQRGVASSVTGYAVLNKRRYPKRTVPWTAETLKTATNFPTLNASRDDRPGLRPLLNINMFVCPPAGRVDLSSEYDPNPQGTFVIGSLEMWWDWQYDRKNPAAGPGMSRVGDRWGWDGVEFEWLVSDLVDEDIAQQDADCKAAHPDDAGAYTNYRWQNQPTIFAIGAYQIPATWAAWFGTGGTKVRGAITGNAAAADGSVVRRVWPRIGADYTNGSQMPDFKDVPVFRNLDRWPGEHNLVPAR